MKIAFYTTKPYDRIWFEPMAERYNMELLFLEAPCRPNTLNLAAGCDAICIFINDQITADMIDRLCEMKIKAILLRSAGFNHVDVEAAARSMCCGFPAILQRQSPNTQPPCYLP